MRSTVPVGMPLIALLSKYAVTSLQAPALSS
jgi:hypothetical protein